MRKKRLGASLALVVALLLLPGVSHALTDEQYKFLYQKPLVGLKGVEIVVEHMDPQAERMGLTRDQIKTDVELRLRKAGVRVLTEKERYETPGTPWLYVNINILFLRQDPLITYHISLELKEWVTLARGFGTHGGIWRGETTGTAGLKQIGRVREFLGDKVDKFINDYLAVNPK